MEHIALVIAPHPDDAEIAMGGTIAALISQGVRIVVLDLTDGEPTPFGSPEIRARETREASQVLGIVERRTLGIKNREIFDTVDNRNAIAAVIREVRPTLLFAPYWEDAHPDHVQASALVDAARFYSKFVKSEIPHEPWYPKKQLYFFSTHLKVRVVPSFIFDISPFIEQKIAALNAYRSQFHDNTKNIGRISEIRREALYWGDQIGVAAGEPFVSREALRLDQSGSIFSL